MTNEQRNRLADAVREGLKRTGLSQKELARKSGTSAGQLCNALSGAGSMSPTKWEMCLEALGQDYHQLMAEEPGVQNEPEKKAGETVEAYGQTYRRIDTEEREAEELRTRLQTVQKELEDQRELNQRLNSDLSKEIDDRTQMEMRFADICSGAKLLENERDALLAEREVLTAERDKLIAESSQLLEQVTELTGDNRRLTEVADHYQELYIDVSGQLKVEQDQREEILKTRAAQFEEASSYYARQLEKLKLAWFDKEHPELA